MGLDITAYRQIKEVRPHSGNDDDGWKENLTSFRNNRAFKGRFAGLKEKTLYSYAEAHGFRAGSYSGYNRWREWLAEVAGYAPTPHMDFTKQVTEKRAAACWNGTMGPFAELIDFSDCEGTIGPRVATKLAKDFAEYDAKAKAADQNEGYDYERYCEWRKAMEMAADNGAVDFH